MPKKIPQLKFRNKSPKVKSFGCVELSDEVIHKIVDLNIFYAGFGYKPEMAQNGIMPDEFIWDTYFRYSDRNCASCYQLHMIEYLLKNSESFAKEYGHECDHWIDAHAKKRAACKIKECAAFKA